MSHTTHDSRRERATRLCGDCATPLVTADEHRSGLCRTCAFDRQMAGASDDASERVDYGDAYKAEYRRLFDELMQPWRVWRRQNGKQGKRGA